MTLCSSQLCMAADSEGLPDELDFIIADGPDSADPGNLLCVGCQAMICDQRHRCRSTFDYH